MKILILDDDPVRHRAAKRAYAGHQLQHAYNMSDFQNSCLTYRFDMISFDHDIGDNTDGYRLACWFFDTIPMDKWPSLVRVHSMNPVGAKKIIDLVRDNGIFVQGVKLN